MKVLIGVILFSCLVWAAPNKSDDFLTDLQNFRNKSLTLQSEEQNLEAARDTLLSKRLFWMPTLSVSANHSRTRLTNTETDSTAESDSKYLQADARWNLFKGGADWNSMNNADARKKAQELQVINESLRVEIQASNLIFKSIYLTEAERIQGQLLKLKEESLKIVRDRYSQGKLPLQDVTKAEVDLAQQKNRLRSAHLEIVENKSEITSLFVSDVKSTEWPFLETHNPHLQKSTKIPLIEYKYWLSQSHEEIWRATKGGHWPSLDLTVQYQESPISERTNRELVGILSLTLPIWNKYETSASITTAYASYVESLNDYKGTEQSLKQKTIFLKEKIETARLNLVEAKKNLDISRRLYQDILKSFRLGRLSTNDLFLEQNRLLDSENSLADSQLAFHQSLIESCALAGLSTSECLL